MRILITGGAGFIGSNFVRNFINGAEITSITVLDSLTYAGNLANLESVSNSPKFNFIKGDICDSELVAKATQNIDLVVHFAAESHVDRSILDPGLFIKTNVLGTQNLLNFSMKNKVQKFIHVSTDEVYGSIFEGSWSEDWPVAPNSPYSASKAGSDLLALSYFKTFGFNVSVTRCSNNYGPYQYPEKVIPLFITNLIEGKRLPIYGSGLNVRDWIHVDDHCDGIMGVIHRGKPGEIYNFGGGNELSNIELAKKILSVVNENLGKIDHVADRKGHDLRYSVSFEKAEKQLGWSPKILFENGLNETISWYRDNRSWWEKLKN
jgi:dTDP-glucose 4,6-dehydratase